MLKRISFIASLLFFLVAGANAFAKSPMETSTPQLPANAVHTAILTSSRPSAAQENGSKVEKTAQTAKTRTLSTAGTDTNQFSLKSYILPAIITLVIVAAFGCYWLIYRKRIV